jgi:hypothetical protein
VVPSTGRPVVGGPPASGRRGARLGAAAAPGGLGAAHTQRAHGAVAAAAVRARARLHDPGLSLGLGWGVAVQRVRCSCDGIITKLGTVGVRLGGGSREEAAKGAWQRQPDSGAPLPVAAVQEQRRADELWCGAGRGGLQPWRAGEMTGAAVGVAPPPTRERARQLLERAWRAVGPGAAAAAGESSAGLAGHGGPAARGAATGRLLDGWRGGWSWSWLGGGSSLGPRRRASQRAGRLREALAVEIEWLEEEAWDFGQRWRWWHRANCYLEMANAPPGSTHAPRSSVTLLGRAAGGGGAPGGHRDVESDMAAALAGSGSAIADASGEWARGPDANRTAAKAKAKLAAAEEWFMRRLSSGRGESFACIGSPCLRQCVHGASIGGGGSGGHSTTGRGLQRQLLGVWLCVGVESATGQPLSEHLWLQPHGQQGVRGRGVVVGGGPPEHDSTILEVGVL